MEEIVQNINIQINKLSERNALDKEFIQLTEITRTLLEPLETKLAEIIKHNPPKPMILKVNDAGKISIEEVIIN